MDSRVILLGTCLKVLSRNTGPAVQEKPVHGSDTNKAHGTDEPETPSFPVVGMAFVDAVIQPLDHELVHDKGGSVLVPLRRVKIQGQP